MRYADLPSLGTWISDSQPLANAAGGGRVAALKASFGTNAPVTAAVRPPLLKTIDDLLRDIAKTYSPMARTNFLTLLEKAIAEWHKANPGPLAAAMAALKEVVDRKLELRAPNSRYDRALCIGYNIGCNYEKATGLMHALGPDSHRNTNYYRHSDDDRMDMESKSIALWNAIVTAYGGIQAIPTLGDNIRTLKVFMAPEFYFRGRNGAYSPDIVSAIIPRMQALGTGGTEFKDWLFIFGTAIASIETQETYCPVCMMMSGSSSNVKYTRDPANPAKTIAKCSLHPMEKMEVGTYGAEIQNVALIQHGSMTHMVAKEYVSRIDFRNRPKLNQGDRNQPTVRKEDGTYLDVLAPQGSKDVSNLRGRMAPVHSDERAGGCIFSIDGITIGLEVCLDHVAGGGQGARFGRASEYAQIIQFLLIPSYGMQIGGGFHCKPGGFAFNVDGRGHGSSDVQVNMGMDPGFYNVAAPLGSLSIFTPVTIPG